MPLMNEHTIARTLYDDIIRTLTENTMTLYDDIRIIYNHIRIVEDVNKTIIVIKIIILQINNIRYK